MFLFNSMVLTNMLSVYSTMRMVFTLIAVVLFIVLVVYGYMVRIDIILSKKFGLRKKREIEQMKAGKALQRRKINSASGNLQTEQIRMDIPQEDNGTALLERTEVLHQPQDNDVTTVLNQKPKDVFSITKDIVVVHGRGYID